MASRKPAEGTEEKPAEDVLRVTAALAQVTTKDGKVLHLREGDIVPSSATDESIEHLKSLGFVK